MVANAEHDQRSTDRARWADDRNGSAGASDAAVIMGEPMYSGQTLLRAYAEKRGEIPSMEDSMLLRFGRHTESFAADEYVLATGRQLVDLGAFEMQRRDDHPYMHATLDRQIMPCEGHDMPGPLEIKNVIYKAKDWEEGVPLGVQIQLQHQMFVTKSVWGSVAAIIQGKDAVQWADFDIHEPFCAKLATKCEAFMNAVREGVPPKATAGDTEVVRLLYPTTKKGTTITLPDEAIELTHIIDVQGTLLDRYGDAVKAAKARLRQLIGDAETAELPGGGAWTLKTVKKNAYEVKASETRQLRRKK